MINTKSLLEKFKFIIKNKKLMHLYLIEGRNQEAKKLFMFELVYDFLKKDKPSSMLKHHIQTFSYPNFYYLDANNTKITKEQILEMQSYFNQTSLLQKKKVYVIDGIENISYRVSNSLLYFLENPINKNTLGLLLTKDRNLLLSTILSRAQIFSLENEYDHNYLFNDKNNNIDELDKSLILLLNKMRKVELDNYYYDLKKFFLFFINNSPENKIVYKLFFDALFIMKQKHFMDDFLFLLMSFFLDLYYKKNNLIFNFSNDLLENSFYNKLSLKLISDILNYLVKMENKKNILEEHFCFLALLIEFNKKIKF
ncbi:hypothetical protein [Candidatus Phytoplasma ziziphi]|uniref:hypothetical protein n=1 Tax=Candidatus Phytoplasma TaxID=33926 RepID=UPI001EDCDC40|nr:hypothetical protein [Candidatus Phytoplasma ziziphi]